MTQYFTVNTVIVGGGSAGIAAAVSAAQEGLSVLLIEQNSYLGGKATASEVGTICGLYAFSKNETSNYVVDGFVKEFAEELKKQSNTIPLHNTMGMHYLPYDIDVYKNLCSHLLQVQHVTTLLNHTLISVNITNQCIQSLNVSGNNQSIIIECEHVIDCSGDAVVSQLANIPVIKSSKYQAAAQVFTMANVSNTSEAMLGMVLIKEIKKGIDNAVLESYYDRVSIVQGSIKNNRVSFKIGIPIEVTYGNANKLEIKQMAHEMVNTLSNYLVKFVPSFKEATLHHIADEVGYRVGVRGKGVFTLTDEDVLSCKKFDSSIANGAWPIEEWGQDKRVQMRYFNHDDYYQIPKECLISNAIENLFFGGRIISATDGAIASARVMGICLQTGYAAGKLAASNK